MRLFCLVHGSTQNPSCWDLLIPELERRGHHAVCPDLPVDEPDASALRYADVIAAAIPPGNNDAIVVAHSASGLFLPLVPGRRRVRRLVYLAAVIPRIGASLMDQAREDQDMFHPRWIGKDPTKDAETAREFLFHDCSPAAAEWALGRMRVLFARRAIFEICPLQVWPEVPSSCIVCADDRTIQPAWLSNAARERLGVEAIWIPGGHCPHVSRPRELAEVLDRIAALDQFPAWCP
jgi:hypothetical protein